jgi:hypothetical protein
VAQYLVASRVVFSSIELVSAFMVFCELIRERVLVLAFINAIKTCAY